MESGVASQIVIIVDPSSTGAAIAKEIERRGYQLVCVPMHGEPTETVGWLAVVESHNLGKMVAKMQSIASKAGAEIVCCMAGSEEGIVLADELATALALPSNGVEPMRRNKSWQQKAVKAAGLRATREVSGTTLAEVASFLAAERYPIIVKPTESAGSDGVKRCVCREAAEAHFELLMRSQHRYGSAGAAVICQEFLTGTEYVVDHVSRHGVHRTVMVWRYDRRPNGSGDFVEFNMLPVPSDAPEVAGLVAYTRGVLDAIGVRHGPTHAEVMLTTEGPCLVEMNCRSHGCSGAWAPLARRLTGGYSQVEAAADCMLDPVVFGALPDVYCEGGQFKAAGQFVQLVSKYEGTIVSVEPLEALRQLRSFVCMHVPSSITPGEPLAITVDIFTAVGFVILCHDDAAVVAADVAAIRALEDAGPLVDVASRDREID